MHRTASPASLWVTICFAFGLCHKWPPLQVICLGGRPHFNGFAQCVMCAFPVRVQCVLWLQDRGWCSPLRSTFQQCFLWKPVEASAEGGLDPEQAEENSHMLEGDEYYVNNRAYRHFVSWQVNLIIDLQLSQTVGSYHLIISSRLNSVRLSLFCYCFWSSFRAFLIQVKKWEASS